MEGAQTTMSRLEIVPGRIMDDEKNHPCQLTYHTSDLSCECPEHVPDMSSGQPNVLEIGLTLHFGGHEDRWVSWVLCPTLILGRK